jgi:hypothetical protein
MRNLSFASLLARASNFRSLGDWRAGPSMGAGGSILVSAIKGHAEGSSECA